MHHVTPIRERNEASQAKRFGFCTCPPSVRRAYATSAVSADTISPRICTFSSHLIFNPLNTYTSAAPISIRFCRSKLSGGTPRTVASQKQTPSLARQQCGGTASSLPSRRASAYSASLRYLFPSAVSLAYPQPVRRAAVFLGSSPAVPCALFRNLRKSDLHLFNKLHTQCFPCPVFSGVCAFRGEGVPPISNIFPFCGLRKSPPNSPRVLSRLSNFGGVGVGTQFSKAERAAVSDPLNPLLSPVPRLSPILLQSCSGQTMTGSPFCLLCGASRLRDSAGDSHSIWGNP